MIDRHIEPEIVATCANHGMGIVVFSPLAQGVLTGKYQGGIPQESRGAAGGQLTEWVKGDLTPEKLATVESLKKIADEAGIPLPQMALAWCLRLPEITSVITGASRPQQVLDNIKAAELMLSDDLLAQIEQVLAN
jgi:aryl-alcohol dehydrogenase-like predicted oxidoreductase